MVAFAFEVSDVIYWTIMRVYFKSTGFKKLAFGSHIYLPFYPTSFHFPYKAKPFMINE